MFKSNAPHATAPAFGDRLAFRLSDNRMQSSADRLRLFFLAAESSFLSNGSETEIKTFLLFSDILYILIYPRIAR